MKKLLLILFCLPMIGSGKDIFFEDRFKKQNLIEKIIEVNDEKNVKEVIGKEKEDVIKEEPLVNKKALYKNKKKKKISEGNGNSDITKVGKDGKDGYYGNRIPVEIPYPEGYSNKKGVVIVQININSEGLVTFAKIVPSFGHKNTTSFDPILRKNSLNAALRSKFTVGDTNDIGYMIYSFDFHISN